MNTPRTPTTIRVLILGITFFGFLALTAYQQFEIRSLRAAGHLPATVTPPAAASRSAATPSSNNTSPREHSPSTGRNDQARENHLHEVESELAEITKPLGQDIASSMFVAEVRESQSVVTGGYLTADGKHQFTFITPKRVKLEDGTEAIRIDTKTIASTPDATHQLGLENLATSARNTLQHAESWENQDVTNTLQKITQTAGTDIITAPSLESRPGQKFTIAIGQEGGTQYSVAGTSDFSTTGPGFILKLRVEQQDAPPAP